MNYHYHFCFSKPEDLPIIITNSCFLAFLVNVLKEYVRDNPKIQNYK